jgi:hypothetical protein
MGIRQVIVTVNGGIADVESYPDDIEVIIVDYDNLNAGDGTGSDSCLCRLARNLCRVCEASEATEEMGRDWLIGKEMGL